MSKELTLITGASGFIGSHVVDATVKAGHNVRLTVRKEKQIEELKTLFSSHASQLDFTVVPDITIPKAFEEAMNGVGYVFHLASPMPGKGEDFKKDYVEPAVKGTESLLQAANATPDVKRVTILASILSLMPMGGMAMADVKVQGKFTCP
jgi:nucleoside-diphosphate-sugar epimerase